MGNKIIHPQEIEVWYILPAIRKELAVSLKQKGLEQKKIAQILGVTEPAVSYYTNNKRASNLEFSPEIKSEITKSVMIIEKDKSKVMKEMQRILSLPQIKKLICKLHKKEGGAEEDCEICKDCI